jgi:hypothetical protein
MPSISPNLYFIFNTIIFSTKLPPILYIIFITHNTTLVWQCKTITPKLIITFIYQSPPYSRFLQAENNK